MSLTNSYWIKKLWSSDHKIPTGLSGYLFAKFEYFSGRRCVKHGKIERDSRKTKCVLRQRKRQHIRHVVTQIPKIYCQVNQIQTEKARYE